MIPDDMETTVSEYKRLRPVMTQLHGDIFKLAKKDALFGCAKRLRMAARQGRKKVIAFANEFEMEVFQDYLIYMYRPRGINLVRQMLNHDRYPPESDERPLLEAMVQARFSVFVVKEMIQKAGFVGLDTASGEELFILDLSLPLQDAVGALVGLRIFPFRVAWVHTGANLSLGRVDDVTSFQPERMALSKMQEQVMNVESIFAWRNLIGRMEREA